MSDPTRRSKLPSRTRADAVLGNAHDPEVYSIGSIDEEHIMIHKGLSYHYSTYISDLDTPSGIKFAVYPTGSSYRCHVTFKGTLVGQAGRVTVYETGAVTVSSSELVLPVNRKRTSDNIAETLLYKDPVVFRSGTNLLDDYIAAGNKLSEEAAHKEEWYLAPNKYYLFSLIPAADNATATFHMNWYEEQED